MAQSVSDIKLAIVELDGCVLPLNHYRYNFYKNLCKNNDVALDHKTYYEALGNMYTMYDSLPLSTELDSMSLNQKVEDDLFDYLKNKGLKSNDGVVELFEYLRQKDIKIAIVTTHKTKNAIAFLELAGLYNKVDYVIGNDTKLQPIPSNDIFEFLVDKYNVTAKQTLLITSILSLLEAGNQSGLNLIYMEDLVSAGEKEKALAMQISAGMYETLNNIIFGRYEDYKMYESVLGYDDDMDANELHEVHKHLESVYQDDEELLDIVNKTYEFKLSELNVNPEDLNDDNNEEEVIEETVEETDTEEVVEETIEEETLTEETEEEIVEDEEDDDDFLSAVNRDVITPSSNEEISEEEIIEEEDDEDDFLAELRELENLDKELDAVKDQSSMKDEETEEEIIEEDEEEVGDTKEDLQKTGSLSLDMEKTIELDDAISKVMKEDKEEDKPKAKVEDIFDDEDEEESEKRKISAKQIGNYIITVLYIFAASLIFLVVCLVAYTALQSTIQYGFLSFLKPIYNAYAAFAGILFGWFSNIFRNADYLSTTAASLLNVYLLNTLIIAIIHIVISVVTKSKKNDA